MPKPEEDIVDDFTQFDPWIQYDAELDHFRLLLVFEREDGRTDGKNSATSFELGLSKKSVERLRDLCVLALNMRDPHGQ